MNSILHDTITSSLLRIVKVIHELEPELSEPEIINLTAEASINLIEFSNIIMYFNLLDSDSTDIFLLSQLKSHRNYYSDSQEIINKEHCKKSYIDLIKQLESKL